MKKIFLTKKFITLLFCTAGGVIFWITPFLPPIDVAIEDRVGYATLSFFAFLFLALGRAKLTVKEILLVSMVGVLLMLGCGWFLHREVYYQLPLCFSLFFCLQYKLHERAKPSPNK